MKFMVIVHPGDRKEYEEGAMPASALVEKMMKFNEALVDAGVMQAGEGLHPTTRGARVFFSDHGAPEVARGPWPESNELVGGFWMWDVSSRDEAIDWAKRAPMEDGAILELREVAEPEVFGEDIAVRERTLMEKVKKQQRS